MGGYPREHIVFRPVSLLYFAFLLVLLAIVFPFILMFLRDILVQDLGLPPEVIGAFLFASLFGSFLNVPLFRLTSHIPVLTHGEVSFFGVTWHVPRVEVESRKTLVSMNVGGALVPILASLYILGWSVPQSDPNPLLTYMKTMLVLAIVVIAVNRTSRLVKGLGIATPAMIPPFITAMVTLLVYAIGFPSSPTKIAYVGGTLGTLIGADLLNMHNLPKLGASSVSIGGAGTFDGVYVTGLISVMLVLLL